MTDEIQAYWQKFSEENNLTIETPNAWMFGEGSENMGNKLGQLVVDGIKTATCSAHILYEKSLGNEPLPKEGQYDIVLDGQNKPLAIIQNVSVEIKKMNEVTADFTRLEGEGDLSYDYWYKAHRRFFTELLKTFDLEFSDEMLIVCEVFKVKSLYHDNNQ